MKKVFALVLAAAMVLSMSAISFATVENLGIEPDYNTASSGVVQMASYGEDTLNYDSIYYLLYDEDTGKFLTTADEVKGLKAKADWEQNEDLVKDIQIVKKKYAGFVGNGNQAAGDGYAYFVEISFNAQNTTSSYDVYGELEVKKGSTKDNVPVFVTLRRSLNKDDTIELTDSNKIYKFKENADNNKGEVEPDEEQEFVLFGGAGWFVVDTYGQNDILLANDVKVSEQAEIEAKYPDINFYYFNGNGAVFNKIGQLKLVAPEDSFLYRIEKDGTLALVENAEYDDSDECWVINTRTLGQYVIADAELEDITDVADPDDVTGVDDVTPPANVETGAAA